MFPFERLVQVLNGLFQEEQFSSLNAVQNAVFMPKERTKSFRTAVRMAKNHDCCSERQPFERHMERLFWLRATGIWPTAGILHSYIREKIKKTKAVNGKQDECENRTRSKNYT